MSEAASLERRPWIGGPDGSGRAVVLIHGAGGDHTVWGDVYSRLRKSRVPVLALDLPGHGRNGTPAPLTVTERVDAVQGALIDARVSACAVVGHSLGGAVALALALRRPPSVRGIAMVSSGARLPVDPRIVAGARAAFGATVQNLARFVFARGVAPERIAAAAEMLAAAGPETLWADFSACASFQVAPSDLRALEIPVEIVCGEADVMTPLALSRELAAALPQPNLTILPGVGHLPLLEDPNGVAIALERLWRRAFFERGASGRGPDTPP